MTKWVRSLLIANVVIFFAQMTLGPSFDKAFEFIPMQVLYRPWTIVTYMFLHGSIGHIFFNMLALFFFGPRVEDRLGSNRFITLYFLSGITGALASFAFARNSAVIGASAGVFGVMLAFAYFWPRAQIMIWGILPVEARVLVLITTIAAIWSGVGGSHGGIADFAHLGGYAGAFVYLKWLDKNQGAKKFRQVAVQPKVADRALANWKRVDPKSVHEVNRDELNRVLDKVSSRGIGSLTPDEKRFLMNFVPPDDRPPLVS